MTNKTYPELVAEGIKRTVFSEAKKMSSEHQKYLEKEFKGFMKNGLRSSEKKQDDWRSTILDYVDENEVPEEEVIKLVKKLKFDDTNMGEMIMEFVEDEL